MSKINIFCAVHPSLAVLLPPVVPIIFCCVQIACNLSHGIRPRLQSAIISFSLFPYYTRIFIENKMYLCAYFVVLDISSDENIPNNIPKQGDPVSQSN